VATSRTSTGRALELLEREGELDEIAACLDDARGGVGRLLMLEGVAGIGKSRLLWRARELAREQGMRVLSARATELEQEFAFGVIRQLLEPALFALTADERAVMFDGAARDASSVFDRAPVEGEAAVRPDSGFTTLGGLYWLLANLAETAPIVLLIDDLQWCDASSERFVRFLLPRLDGIAIAVIVAQRPGEPAAPGEIPSDPAARSLRPAPLSPGAVAAMVRARVDAGAEDGFCKACWRACGGNPFLLGELLAELSASGCRGTDAEAASVHEVAPASVQRAITTRIERLGAQATAYARAVAVLGDGARASQTARFAGLEPAVADGIADALAGAGVLEPGSPARFLHPMIRNAVYAGLGRREAARSHARAAGLLIADGAEPERVAVHLLRTEDVRDPESARILIDAARQAAGRGAPDAAIAYLRRALSTRVEPDLRRGAIRMLIGAARASLDVTALDGVCEHPAAELGDADPVAIADVATWLHMAGRVSDAVAAIDAGVARAEAAGDMDGVLRLEPARNVLSQTPPLQSRARIERYADRIPPGSLAERLLLALRAHWMALEGESAVETARLARRALGDGSIFGASANAVAFTFLPFVLVLTEDLDAADAALSQWHAATRTQEGVFGAATATAGHAYMALARGDVALAEAGLQAGVDLLDQSGSDAVALEWTGALVETLIERGDIDGAERALRAAWVDGELPEGQWGTELQLARGRLRGLQGRREDAIDDFLAVRDYVERSGEANPAWLPWASAAAPVLASAGRGEEARVNVEDELARARRWGAPGPIGRALRTLGVLDSDVRRLREAVTVLEPSSTRLEHLRALVDLGSALRRKRERVAAREPLRVALAEARRRGALAIAQRAAEELEATGETVRAALSSGVASLTPSERRIAAAAAEGRSNRDIAQALFVSVKTVETHLSAVYRKLDIAGRAQLATALDR
jgi:DNA-binding CsgD family transcriptional regulator